MHYCEHTPSLPAGRRTFFLSILQVGDKISFVSATFGDQIWSAKGVGLSRVQSAIKVTLRWMSAE